MRKILGTWLPIGILVVILASVYFRQWFLTAREIRAAQESQKTDIQLLLRAKSGIHDISSQSLSLRLKMYGPEAAEEAVLSTASNAPSAALPSSVVAAMKRHAVRIVFFRQSAKGTQVQFEGAYDGLIQFLNAAAPDMPRIDGFVMERSEKNMIKLTIAVAA